LGVTGTALGMTAIDAQWIRNVHARVALMKISGVDDVKQAAWYVAHIHQSKL
jgi:hypothetical protein